MPKTVKRTSLAACFTLIALLFIVYKGHNMSKIILISIIILQLSSLALTLPRLNKNKNNLQKLLNILIILTTVLPLMIWALVFALGFIHVPY